MVAALMFEVEHQGGQIVVEIGFERVDVYLVDSGSTAIALDGLKGTAHASHVDSSGQGMGDTALVGQPTLLAERRCCEAMEAEPAGHSHLGRRLFRSAGLPETSQADARRRHLAGKHTRPREYQPLLETTNCLTADRYSPSPVQGGVLWLC